MDDVSLSVASVLPLLLDRPRRRALLAALHREGGEGLAVRNRYAEVAPRCLATPEELRAAVLALLQEELRADADLLASDLVYHREMPDDVLLLLLDRRMCLAELAHRAGPRVLLERLALEHGFSEAITTLALDYYGADEVSVEDFAQFVARHRENRMLAYTLRRAAHLSEDKRQRALALVGGMA